MLLDYGQAVSLYGNPYRLDKAVLDNNVRKIEPGVYSTESYVPEIAVISKKYPNAIFTGANAYYHHNLTDIIPDKYALATVSKAAKIADSRVMQRYVGAEIFSLGAVEEDMEGYTIRMYDKERMLIELLRNKNSMPYDLYKEVLNNYRKIIATLEIWRIQDYLKQFPKQSMISKLLDAEVF